MFQTPSLSRSNTNGTDYTFSPKTPAVGFANKRIPSTTSAIHHAHFDDLYFDDDMPAYSWSDPYAGLHTPGRIPLEREWSWSYQTANMLKP